MAVIEVKDLVKTYVTGLISRTSVNALRGASFEVEEGEIFGILGPNGAGKTTLMKILTGLIGATSGSARIFGQTAGTSAVRRRVGYLPEHHRFPEYLTGAQAMDYYGCLSGMSMREVKARKDEVLDLVGMAEWQNTKLSQYSKGMGQRLGLAQALIHDPEIIFLDEPTDGVDPVGRKEIRAVLNTLSDLKKTVFINSHLLQEVELVCKRVSIMSQGRVLKTGTISEITAREPQIRIQTTTSVAEALVEINALSDAFNLTEAEIYSETGANHFQIVMPATDTELVNKAIDIIRSKSILIAAVLPLRVSLEDAFLEAIDGQRQVGAKVAKAAKKVAKAKVVKAKPVN